MQKIISKYIDANLIDEYANKSSRDGYELCISQIPEPTLNNFLNFLFERDDVLREIAMDRMQDLIDEELSFAESRDKYDAGYWPVQDQNNGELFWNKL